MRETQKRSLDDNRLEFETRILNYDQKIAFTRIFLSCYSGSCADTSKGPEGTWQGTLDVGSATRLLTFKRGK